MNRFSRYVLFALLVFMLPMCRCSENPCNPCTWCDQHCVLSTDSLFFGEVAIGESGELAFFMRNACESALAGTLSLTCDQFSLIGDTVYELSQGDSAEFTVRFSPVAEGSSFCTVETGHPECAGVFCKGVGAEPPGVVFRDDFEDDDMEGWLHQHVCSSIYSYTYDVVYSSQDTSMVLKHHGGVSSGGGNGEAYVANGVSLEDVSITADIRNVDAFHSSAKAVGLTACLNKATGVQYLAWYTVEGNLFLYETRGWLSCGPTYLEHVVTNSLDQGDKINLKLTVNAGLISVWLNGTEVLSYDDSASPLPAGSAGLVATAGVTYFDNIVITTGSM